ncbi:MAG: FAD-dependent oxidoreductase [Proteobacteria bacterium]|nr:FAD-dependent oxidoreductase [Pseudomonadota bacterium]
MAIPTATVVKTRSAQTTGWAVDADICVAGAGISGISAALEASRLGRKVVLVDGLPALGGQAVNSIIGTFCGLFANGANRYQFTRGIADEILDELGSQGDLHYNHGPDRTVVYYDEIALSRWIEKKVQAAGIEVIVGAVIRNVVRQDRRITMLDVATRYGDVQIRANGFVDATGDAVLAWQAGLPCREPSDGPIYGTQMVVLEGIDDAQIPTRQEVIDRLQIKARDYGVVREDGLGFFFQGRGTAAFNMTHIETPLEPLAASRIGLEGKDQADNAVTFLKGEFPMAFKDSRVRAYGQPGVRQTRWITGDYHLTVEDVRAGTEFDDAVARTAWGIEIHDNPDRIYWEDFEEGHVHHVPLRSMTPRDTDNLVAAGRCIDADVAALSSVRVMGPCIAMGAGAAHALDLAGDGSVHQIDLTALRSRLHENLETRTMRAET